MFADCAAINSSTGNLEKENEEGQSMTLAQWIRERLRREGKESNRLALIETLRQLKAEEERKDNGKDNTKD